MEETVKKGKAMELGNTTLPAPRKAKIAAKKRYVEKSNSSSDELSDNEERSTTPNGTIFPRNNQIRKKFSPKKNTVTCSDSELLMSHASQNNMTSGENCGSGKRRPQLSKKKNSQP